jgi:hypothetical protein
MGSFQQGFQMGSNIMSEMERERMAKEELAMRKEAAAREQADFESRQADRRRVDSAFGEYEALHRPTTTGGPLRPEGDQPYNYQPVDFTPPPTGPDADLARERALGRIAVARRDSAGIRDSATAERALRQSGIVANAMRTPVKEIEALLPQLNTNNSNYPVLYTGKDKNGYTFLTTDPDGTPGKPFKMNEPQMRQFYLAHQLAEAGYGAEALTLLTTANKELGEHVKNWNTAMQTAGTTSNDARHKGNQDANDARRARASEVSAGASATSAAAQAALARTHGQLYQTQIDEITENRKNNGQARALAEEFESLSPQDQAGPRGQSLIRRFNILNAKPGTPLAIGATGAGANGRLPQTLDDREKLAYQKALDEISMLAPGPNGQVNPNQVKQVYMKYGLDPARFGVETELDRRLKAMGGEQGAGPVTDPSRPFFNTPTEQLRALARKPRGTSTEEANRAREELELRATEPRLSAF